MVNETIRKYNRTNIFVINEELWAWAQYRAKTLGYSSTSEYIFDLIKLDKKESLLKQLANKKLGEG
jgi:prophage antirepressor-like protein